MLKQFLKRCGSGADRLLPAEPVLDDAPVSTHSSGHKRTAIMRVFVLGSDADGGRSAVLRDRRNEARSLSILVKDDGNQRQIWRNHDLLGRRKGDMDTRKSLAKWTMRARNGGLRMADIAEFAGATVAKHTIGAAELGLEECGCRLRDGMDGNQRDIEQDAEQRACAGGSAAAVKSP